MASGEAEDPAAEAEGPTEPTHEPFSLKVLSTVQVHRASNGLRHNDHLRYRQYCTRRLRRLYVALRFKHGKGRFKQATFPGNFDDPKWVYVPLVLAERAWAFGVQLKADNAAAAAFNARWRHRSVQRFAKATKYAQQLESVCKVHCDQRTQLEAEAYCALLEGTWLLERESWAEAKTKLARCKKLCEHFSLAADQAEAVLFRTQIQELAPMLRECRYNLGEAEDDDDGKAKVATGATAAQDAKSGLNYRGQTVSMPSEKIKSRVMKCVESAKALQAEADSEETPGASAIEKYGELSVEFGDALKDIHADMIAAGADGEAVEWRMIEAFTREVSVCTNIERNLILLRNHLAKLDEFEDVSTSEARRQCRPEEGMRFCDLVKEDLESLSDLPESSDSLEAALSAYTKAVLNYRCLYLALCQTAIGKPLEAAALLEMLSGRLEEAAPASDASQSEPLARLQGLFERIAQRLPSRVAQWRCRVLVHLAKENIKTKSKDSEAEATGPAATAQQKPKQDALAAFPPRFRDIPCKPLLFDLAFPCVEAPDFDEVLPKKAEGQQKAREAAAAVAGALGRVAGGLGGRLGGLFGRK